MRNFNLHLAVLFLAAAFTLQGQTVQHLGTNVFGLRMVGNAGGLTNLTGANVTGTVPNATRAVYVTTSPLSNSISGNASTATLASYVSGILTNTVALSNNTGLPGVVVGSGIGTNLATLAALAADNIFTGNSNRVNGDLTVVSNLVVGSALFTTLTAATFSVTEPNGSIWTNLNGTEIRTGTVAPARLGTGSGGSSKFLREDSTFQTIPGGGDMLGANNLSDVASAGQSRTNLVAHNASNLSIGVVPDALLANNVQRTNDAIAASRLTSDGTDMFFWYNNAGGFDLTIDGESFTNLNASSLASGTVADARLSTNVLLLKVAGTNDGDVVLSKFGGPSIEFTDTDAVSLGWLKMSDVGTNFYFIGGTVNAGSFAGDGSGLTSLNAANITADGQLPRLKMIGLDVVTNLWTINTAFGLGTNYTMTSGATTGGITGLSGEPTTTERIGQLVIKTTGDLVFTNPVAFYASDGLDSRTFTNGNLTTVLVQELPGFSTNLVFSWSK